MLNQNFALNLSACLSGSSFSFDELILGTKSLFEREGTPGFLRVLPAFIDVYVVEQWFSQHGKKCCESPTFVRAGKKSKPLFTSIGKVQFEWSRVRCKSCGKIHNPLKDFFEFGRYQTKSSELEKICLEVIAEDSYRKGTGKIKKGEDFEVKSNSGRYHINIIGAIDIESRDMVTKSCDSVNTESVCELLKALMAKHLSGELIHLFLDNSPIN
jgi:hypothetical protein